MRFPVSAACLVLLASAGAVRADDTYVLDFFPEGLQTNHAVALIFVPAFSGEIEVGGQIFGTRLVLDFETANGFDASELFIQLVMNSGSTFIALTGEELGWSGQGEFHADLLLDDLNGTLGPGVAQFDLGTLSDPSAYSGTFSNDSRFELYLKPIPAPGGVCVLAGAGLFAGARRRRG